MVVKTNPEFKDVLLKLRRELGNITQKKLGIMLGGFTDATISLWESGQVKPHSLSLLTVKDHICKIKDRDKMLTPEELAVFER